MAEVSTMSHAGVEEATPANEWLPSRPANVQATLVPAVVVPVQERLEAEA